MHRSSVTRTTVLLSTCKTTHGPTCLLIDMSTSRQLEGWKHGEVRASERRPVAAWICPPVDSGRPAGTVPVLPMQSIGKTPDHEMILASGSKSVIPARLPGRPPGCRIRGFLTAIGRMGLTDCSARGRGRDTLRSDVRQRLRIARSPDRLAPFRLIVEQSSVGGQGGSLEGGDRKTGQEEPVFRVLSHL